MAERQKNQGSHPSQGGGEAIGEARRQQPLGREGLETLIANKFGARLLI